MDPQDYSDSRLPLHACEQGKKCELSDLSAELGAGPDTLPLGVCGDS